MKPSGPSLTQLDLAPSSEHALTHSTYIPSVTSQKQESIIKMFTDSLLQSLSYLSFPLKMVLIT